MAPMGVPLSLTLSFPRHLSLRLRGISLHPSSCDCLLPPRSHPGIPGHTRVARSRRSMIGPGERPGMIVRGNPGIIIPGKPGMVVLGKAGVTQVQSSCEIEQWVTGSLSPWPCALFQGSRKRQNRHRGCRAASTRRQSTATCRAEGGAEEGVRGRGAELDRNGAGAYGGVEGGRNGAGAYGGAEGGRNGAGLRGRGAEEDRNGAVAYEGPVGDRNGEGAHGVAEGEGNGEGAFRVAEGEGNGEGAYGGEQMTPEEFTGDELHFVDAPGGWRLALWRYNPSKHAPNQQQVGLSGSTGNTDGDSSTSSTSGPSTSCTSRSRASTSTALTSSSPRGAGVSGSRRRAHPVLLLSGIATNALGFDLSPEVSLARHLRDCGFDTWVLEMRGAGLSHRVEDTAPTQTQPQSPTQSQTQSQGQSESAEGEREGVIGGRGSGGAKEVGREDESGAREGNMGEAGEAGETGEVGTARGAGVAGIAAETEKAVEAGKAGEAGYREDASGGVEGVDGRGIQDEGGLKRRRVMSETEGGFNSKAEGELKSEAGGGVKSEASASDSEGGLQLKAEGGESQEGDRKEGRVVGSLMATVGRLRTQLQFLSSMPIPLPTATGTSAVSVSTDLAGGKQQSDAGSADAALRQPVPLSLSQAQSQAEAEAEERVREGMREGVEEVVGEGMRDGMGEGVGEWSAVSLSLEDWLKGAFVLQNAETEERSRRVASGETSGVGSMDSSGDSMKEAGVEAEGALGAGVKLGGVEEEEEEDALGAAVEAVEELLESCRLAKEGLLLDWGLMQLQAQQLLLSLTPSLLPRQQQVEGQVGEGGTTRQDTQGWREGEGTAENMTEGLREAQATTGKNTEGQREGQATTGQNRKGLIPRAAAEDLRSTLQQLLRSIPPSAASAAAAAAASSGALTGEGYLKYSQTTLASKLAGYLFGVDPVDSLTPEGARGAGGSEKASEGMSGAVSSAARRVVSRTVGRIKESVVEMASLAAAAAAEASASISDSTSSSSSSTPDAASLSSSASASMARVVGNTVGLIRESVVGSTVGTTVGLIRESVVGSTVGRIRESVGDIAAAAAASTGRIVPSRTLSSVYATMVRLIVDAQATVRAVGKYDWDLDSYLQEDLPAAIEYIVKESAPEDGGVLAVGHSMGGILLYCRLAALGPDAKLAGVVTVASSLEYWVSNTSLKLLLPLAPPARRLQWGAIPMPLLSRAALPLITQPPNALHWIGLQVSARNGMDQHLFEKLMRQNFVTIPVRLLLQLESVFYPGGLRSRSGGISYRKGLRDCTTPVLALAADSDLICPPIAVTDTLKAFPPGVARYQLFGAEKAQSEEEEEAIPSSPSSAGEDASSGMGKSGKGEESAFAASGEEALAGKGKADSSTGHIELPPAGSVRYGHYDLLVGKKAAEEVYPAIIEFLVECDSVSTTSGKAQSSAQPLADTSSPEVDGLTPLEAFQSPVK